MPFLEEQFALAREHCGHGQLNEASQTCERILQTHPAHFGAWFVLGFVHQSQGRPAEAVHCYREAIRYQPEFVEAHHNLGVVLELQGRTEEAVAQYREALRLRPEFSAARQNLVTALNHRGNVCRQHGETAAAGRCYQEALALDPTCAVAHNNLGVLAASQGQTDAAQARFLQAVHCQPNHAEALSNLGNSYKDQGQLDEALDAHRRAVAAEPTNAVLGSNLLLALHYHPGLDAETIFAEHLAWAKHHAVALGPPLDRRLSSPRGEGRRLRIGYVSADFRQHVMGFFMEAVLACHDRDHFEIVCYSDVAKPDHLTKRLVADRWRAIVGSSDAEVAELIRQDSIDILVDLAGHTAGNRLLVFARKPAPVQVTHFGYMHTSGLATMDYRLTDACCDPPGMTERYHTEKLFRLPNIGWCYQPPACPEVGELPATRHGGITFGSLNNLAKVSAEAIAVWARILEEVAESRLLILAGAGEGGDQRLRELFGRHGVGPERLLLVGRRSRADYFALYEAVDIALDSSPYSGCNTTMDALWMGVPVVTLAGRNAMGRQGVGILQCVGLPELIAARPERYVAIAVEQARDLSALANLRAGLRQRLQNSPLTDAAGFTRRLEEAYQCMWKMH
jgi:predicted O-linked N-acetylglucosamine transferase (SPINDLY family)